MENCVIIAIALSNTLITDVDAQESGGDACEIVDKALRIDELPGYYHIDVLSNRKPLRMLGNDFVNCQVIFSLALPFQ